MNTACSASLNTKLPLEEKELFNKTVAELGLTPSSVIRSFVRKFNECGGYPYDVRLQRPMSYEEVASIKELEDSIKAGTAKRYQSFNELLADLDNA